MPPQNGHPAAFATPCRPIRQRGLDTTQRVSEAESALRMVHRIQDCAEANREPEEMPTRSRLNPIVTLPNRNGTAGHDCSYVFFTASFRLIVCFILQNFLVTVQSQL